MGVFTDLSEGVAAIGASNPGIDKNVRRELKGLGIVTGDPVLTGVEISANEVQTITQFSVNPVTPATYTLTFNLFGGYTYTTAAIAFGANAATVQTAVDTAVAAYPSYVAGHIAVTGGGLNAAAFTLTFSGASVAGKQHGQTTITSNAVPTASTPVTTSTPGDVSHNEVQSIAAFVNVPTAGTYTLSITTAGKAAVTTAGIAIAANAATIKTAINTAMTASADKPVGWTNDDIAVSGGPLTTTPVVLTFSGTSVTNADQGLTSISTTGVTKLNPLNGTPQATTTGGSTGRPAWEALQLAGIIGGTIPAQGSDASSITDAGGWLHMPQRLSDGAIRALAMQASIEDSYPPVYGQILDLLGISR